MSTLPEQFSAVRKSQVEAQLNFFQNFTAKSLESVQKIIALNLSVSRASMEKSSAAVAQLLTVKDPRDLFALTNNTQESLNGMLAYSRELIAIASGTGAALADTAMKAAPELDVALALVKDTVEEVQAAAQEWTEPEPAVAAQAAATEFVAPVAEPEPAAVEAATATPAAPPEAEVTPIAKAVSKVANKAVAAKPAAAPVPAAKKTTVVTGLKPVEASPPPAPVSGKPAIAQQQLDLPAAKSKKRK